MRLLLIADTHFAHADVLVFGHSHIPWDTVTPGGMRLLDPGSPTDRRRMPAATYLTCEAAAGALHDVRLHELPTTSAGAHRAAGAVG